MNDERNPPVNHPKVSRKLPIKQGGKSNLISVLMKFIRGLIRSTQVIVVDTADEVYQYLKKWDGDPEIELPIPGEMEYYIILIVKVPIFSDLGIVIRVY